MRFSTHFNSVRNILVVGISIYTIVCIYIYFIQDELLYYPDIAGHALQATPQNLGLQYEEVNLTTADNVKLFGWFVPAKQAKGVVLFFHGNAGNISHRLRSIRIFHDLRLSVFIFDYRGYGRSEGKISEPGSYQDAEAAWFYLTRTRGISAKQIIIFGRSLGGSIGAWLASHYQPAAVIIESSFSSIASMGSRLYPALPITLLSRYHYTTVDYVKHITVPILVVHSIEDDIIPYEEGRLIFAAANPPKQFLQLRGGHNNGFIRTGSEYIRGLQQFIDANLPPKNKP